MKTHNLKCWPSFFDDLRNGRKTFDIRNNDRGFQTGDRIIFRKFCPQKQQYIEPPEQLAFVITYVLSGFGLQNDYVCLGLRAESERFSKSIHEAMRGHCLSVLQHAEENNLWVEVALHGGSKEKYNSRHLIKEGFPEVDGDWKVSLSNGGEGSWWYSVGVEPGPHDPPTIIGIVKVLKFSPAANGKLQTESDLDGVKGKA